MLPHFAGPTRAERARARRGQAGEVRHDCPCQNSVLLKCVCARAYRGRTFKMCDHQRRAIKMCAPVPHSKCLCPHSKLKYVRAHSKYVRAHSKNVRAHSKNMRAHLKMCAHSKCVCALLKMCMCLPAFEMCVRSFKMCVRALV